MNRRLFIGGVCALAPSKLLAQEADWHHHRHSRHSHHHDQPWQRALETATGTVAAGETPTGTATTATPAQAAQAPTASAAQAATAPTATQSQAASAPSATQSQAASAPTASQSKATSATTATAEQAAAAPTATQEQAAQSPAAQGAATAAANYAAVLPNPSGGDDTAAINKCLASVAGGIVHAPAPNTWRHNNIITIPAGVVLQGDGDQSVFLATDTLSNPNMAIVLNGTAAGLAYVMLTTSYPTGKGMSPGDGSGAGYRSSQPFSHCVYVVHGCQSFSINHVHSVGGASGGIYVAGAAGGMIQYCTVEYALADGIGLYQGTSNTYVQNCTVTGCGDDGISIVPYAGGPQGSGIVIQNNIVSGGYWGRGITDVGSNGALIQGNTVSGYYASGLLADQDSSAGTTAPTGGKWDNNTVVNSPNPASGYVGEFFVYRNVSNYTVINNHAVTIPGGCNACVIDSSSKVMTYSGNSWQ